MENGKVRYEYKDDLEWIRVIDYYPQRHRYLHFEDTIQGVINLGDHHKPPLEYIGIMADAARQLLTNPSKILIGGLGSCALLHAINESWGHYARVISVESSERVYEVARKWFRLDPKSKVLIGDLREKLALPSMAETDLMLIDCYTAASIPPHLITLEFMTLLSGQLSDRGHVIFNLWSPLCNQMCGDQIRTILEVFDVVGVISCYEDDNVIVIAGPDIQKESNLHFKGLSYRIPFYERAQKEDWPDFMKGSSVLRDGLVNEHAPGICFDLNAEYE